MENERQTDQTEQPDPLRIKCPVCDAPPGKPCARVPGYHLRGKATHRARRLGEAP